MAAKTFRGVYGRNLNAHVLSGGGLSFGISAEEPEAAIREMLPDNKETRKLLAEAIKTEILTSTKAVRMAAKSFVGTGYKTSHGDPHEAYKAVRATIWNYNTHSIGGSINIMEKHHKKGDRLVDRDENGDYRGEDRGFILRFVNSGTRDRYTGGRNKRRKGAIRVIAKNNKITVKDVQWRGKIKGANWFEQTAVYYMRNAQGKVVSKSAETLLKRFEKA